MDISFDPAKNESNFEKHGLWLSGFEGFDSRWRILIDDRIGYGEVRYQGRGRIDGKGYCVVFTVTATGIRLISFRRAHEKEMRRYE